MTPKDDLRKMVKAYPGSYESMAPRVGKTPEVLRAARKLGLHASEASLAKAETKDPRFGEKAHAFIVAFVAKHESVPGEVVTLAARMAGIRPHDDRAFGSVYAKAIRKGAIKLVGHTQRVRGHGTAGGRVYAPGSQS